MVNQWLNAMFKLFRPHIESLLKHRDEVISAWALDKPKDDVLEDRKLEITGSYTITVDQWISQLESI